MEILLLPLFCIGLLDCRMYQFMVFVACINKYESCVILKECHFKCSIYIFCGISSFVISFEKKIINNGYVCYGFNCCREPFVAHHGVESVLLLKHLEKKCLLMRTKCMWVQIQSSSFFLRNLLFIIFFCFYICDGFRILVNILIIHTVISERLLVMSSPCCRSYAIQTSCNFWVLLHRAVLWWLSLNIYQRFFSYASISCSKR